MTEPVWFIVEEVRSGSWRGTCHYTLATEGGPVRCGHWTAKMGSPGKIERAIKDHLRDVHGVVV